MIIWSIILSALIFGATTGTFERILHYNPWPKGYWSRDAYEDDKINWFDNLLPMFRDGGHLLAFIQRIAPSIPIFYTTVWSFAIIWIFIQWAAFVLTHRKPKK